MAMTDAELYEIARALGRRIYVDAGATADTDLLALKAAVGAIDNAMNATTNQVATAYPGSVLKVAMSDYAKSQAANLTTQQAGTALALWALKEVGLL